MIHLARHKHINVDVLLLADQIDIAKNQNQCEFIEITLHGNCLQMIIFLFGYVPLPIYEFLVGGVNVVSELLSLRWFLSAEPLRPATPTALGTTKTPNLLTAPNASKSNSLS